MSEQLYIKYRSFDPLGDPTYKITIVDWFIMRRSYLTHTEIEFPKIYGCISFSATRADSCKCARFKMIDYTKHPKRWKTVLIPVTREQCYLMFVEACRMADRRGIRWSCVKGLFHADQTVVKKNAILYGPNALRYDLLGLLSFTTRWTIIRPHSKYCWCTEACHWVLWVGRMEALVEAGKKPDKLKPDTGHEIIEELYGKVA